MWVQQEEPHAQLGKLKQFI